MPIVTRLRVNDWGQAELIESKIVTRTKDLPGGTFSLMEMMVVLTSQAPSTETDEDR